MFNIQCSSLAVGRGQHTAISLNQPTGLAPQKLCEGEQAGLWQKSHEVGFS